MKLIIDRRIIPMAKELQNGTWQMIVMQVHHIQIQAGEHFWCKYKSEGSSEADKKNVVCLDISQSKIPFSIKKWRKSNLLRQKICLTDENSMRDFNFIRWIQIKPTICGTFEKAKGNRFI